MKYKIFISIIEQQAMNKEQLMQIWGIFDVEGKGIVPVERIINKINEVGVNLSNEALQKLDYQLDPERKG